MGRLYSTKLPIDVPRPTSPQSVAVTAPHDSAWSTELGGVLASQATAIHIPTADCWAVAEGSDPADPYSVRMAVKAEVDVVVSPGALVADGNNKKLARPGHAFGYFADHHVTTLELTNVQQPPGKNMVVPTFPTLDPTPAGGYSMISYTTQNAVSAQGGTFTCVSIEHSDTKSAEVQVADFTLNSVRDGVKAAYYREYSRPGPGGVYDQSRPGAGLLSAPYYRAKAGEVLTQQIGDSFAILDPENQVITAPAPVTTSDQTYTSQALWPLDWAPDRAIRESVYRIGIKVTHSTRYVFVTTYDWSKWTYDLTHGNFKQGIWNSWVANVTTTFEASFSPGDLFNSTWEQIKGG